MPGATLGRGMGYTGPGGPLNSLFSLNPQSQSIYDQGMKGFQSMTDPTGGIFQNYLSSVLGPTVMNNAIAMGQGRSGAALGSISNAGANAAMQYANLYPGLIQSGLSLGQYPQTLALQGLSTMGLPLAQQDQANLQTGYQAAGVPRTMAQQFGLQNQNLLYSMLTGLPFPTGQTQTGRGEIQNTQNALSSVLAPMASMAALGLGQNGGAGFANLGKGLMSLGSSAMSGLGSLFGSSAPSIIDSLSPLVDSGVPEAGGGLLELLSSIGFGGDLF